MRKGGKLKNDEGEKKGEGVKTCEVVKWKVVDSEWRKWR